MRNSLMILFLILSGSSAFAQNLTRSVLASGGGYWQSSGGPDLEWTLGELTTEYLQNGPSIQQGLQQAELKITVRLSEPLSPSDSWQVFPNPAVDYLQVETTFTDPWQYKLQDMLGRQILQGTSVVASHQLRLPNLEAGIYLIRVHNQLGHSASKKIFIHQN